MFIVVTLAAMITIGVIYGSDPSTKVYEKIGFFFASMFMAEFALLMLSLAILTACLVKKKRKVHHGVSASNFRFSMCILVTIVLIFSLSFPFRVLNDFEVIYPYNSTTSYQSMLYDLFLGIPYDLLPIMLILFLHRRNFRKKKRSSKLDCDGETNTELTSEPSLSNSTSMLSASDSRQIETG